MDANKISFHGVGRDFMFYIQQRDTYLAEGKKPGKKSVWTSPSATFRLQSKSSEETKTQIKTTQTTAAFYHFTTER